MAYIDDFLWINHPSSEEYSGFTDSEAFCFIATTGQTLWKIQTMFSLRLLSELRFGSFIAPLLKVIESNSWDIITYITMRAIPALYIHLPFCPSKCFFCDFPVIAGPVHSQYSEHLIKDMYETANRFPTSEKLSSVYIGGGTPSLYPDLPLIFENLHRTWQIAPNCEITLECNPGTIGVEKLKTLKQLGVNRIQVGAQIMNDDILKECNRKHTTLDTYQLIEDILKSGYDISQVSVDIICGLPKVTDQIWTNTLEWLNSVKPGHIACYMLNLEPNTPFHTSYYQGNLELPSDDKAKDMYIQACDSFKQYDHYEISSFALENCRSVHNSMYWKGDVPFYGIGMGATSYLDSCRYTRPTTLKSYYDFLEKYPEKQFPKEEMLETLRNIFMYQIRLKEGIQYQEFKKYGSKIMSALNYIADNYRDFIVDDPQFLKLKDPEGFLISKEVAIEIFMALDNSPKFNLN